MSPVSLSSSNLLRRPLGISSLMLTTLGMSVPGEIIMSPFRDVRRAIVTFSAEKWGLYPLDERIEHAHFRPVLLHLGNEAVVGRIVLVGVVGGAVGEDDVQGNVELTIVDVALQSRVALSAAEVLDPRLDGQVLLARGDEGIDRGRGAIFEGEVDIVAEEHGVVSQGVRG